MSSGRKSFDFTMDQYCSSISRSMRTSLPCVIASSREIVLTDFTALTSSMIPVSCGSVTWAPSFQ